MKVYLSEYVHPKAVERIRERAEIVSSFDAIQEVDAIILRAVDVTREHMLAAKNLKVIGKHGVGFNTIDVDAARELGIRVVYTPGTNTQSVAEAIVGLILDASRSLTASHIQCARGAIKRIGPQELIGRELQGKVLGLIGVGNISQRVAGILAGGFEMQAIGYDAYLPDPVWERSGVVRCNTLEEVLERSDYISISVPLNEETTNLIAAEQLRRMKQDAVLVNASRGGVVNERDLCTALREGWIRAAASDVFVEEPPDGSNPLMQLPNFVGTPHIGGNTVEATERVGLAVVEDVFRVLDGKDPLNAVV